MAYYKAEAPVWISAIFTIHRSFRRLSACRSIETKCATRLVNFGRRSRPSAWVRHVGKTGRLVFVFPPRSTCPNRG